MNRTETKQRFTANSAETRGISVFNMSATGTNLRSLSQKSSVRSELTAMNAAVTPVLTSASRDAKPRASSSVSDRLLGIALMAVPSAVFWVAVMAAAAAAFGYEMSFDTLVHTGAGITLFLAVVGAAVTHRQV